jgi:hypothetical protein
MLDTAIDATRHINLIKARSAQQGVIKIDLFNQALLNRRFLCRC